MKRDAPLQTRWLSQIKRDLIPVVVVVVVVVYEAQLGAESAPSLTIFVFRIS